MDSLDGVHTIIRNMHLLCLNVTFHIIISIIITIINIYTVVTVKGFILVYSVLFYLLNVKMPLHNLLYTHVYYLLICISGWIFQKVLAEIVQKDLILSQKALISNRRNLGLFAPTSMRFPSKDSKSKDLSF